MTSGLKSPTQNLKTTFRRLIKKYCRNYGVAWTYIYKKTKGREHWPLWGSSTSSVGYIKTPEITPHSKYPHCIFSIALHELGHCLDYESKNKKQQNTDIKHSRSSYGRGHTTYFVLQCEMIAWMIAEQIGKPLWNSICSRVRNNCMAAYTRSYNRCHKRKFTPHRLRKKILRKFSPDFFSAFILPKQKSSYRKSRKIASL